MNVYTCDFETSTDEMVQQLLKEGKIEKECAWVWLACAYNTSTDKYDIFNNIDDFMDFFSTKKSEVFFHNLKFDGKYILSWLLKNNFENITGMDVKPKSKSYVEVIDEMGNFYSIEIYFKVGVEKVKKTGKEKRRYIGHMIIRDSLKKIPMSVGDMGTAYNVCSTKMEVEESFYNIPRLPYKHVATEEEIEYIVRDCKTVKEVLQKHEDEDMIKNTVSSNALYQWTKRIRKRHPGDDEKTHMKRCKETVDTLFPKLPADVERMARDSYFGGWTYCKEEKQWEIGEGSSYDVCSLYPSRMRKCLLPYGLPVITDGDYMQNGRQLNKEYYDKSRPFKIIRLRACFDLKKDHVPSLMANKHNKNKSSFLVTSDFTMMDLTLTSIDWELMQQQYIIHDYEILEIQHYKVSNKIFNEHIDYWYSVKESEKYGNQALYQLAKLMLNSLYGKFGNNCMKKNKVSYLEDGKVKYYTTEEKEVEGFSYVPMASAITSHARYLTITSAQKVYHRFIYADTDSLYLIGKEEPDCLEIGLELGQWNKEHEFERGRFIKQKTYIIEGVEDGKPYCMVKCAGMSKKCKINMNFDNFKINDEIDTDMFTYKLKTLEGGCHIVKYPFKIKVDKSGNFYGNTGGECNHDVEDMFDNYYRG